eukprot:NODE_116_length_3099_cov_33.815612_g109_i0.p1 GENE.NODE_116_length_3099_cov_33.815612_g109_i0~~NODE_116_length_3099_cov_33.815612_g109_i0.p1  ORF type:complete len:583 (-),score=122.06 NODE_116_length_3099_cov_33.815612_g109_i0:145-1893(-)
MFFQSSSHCSNSVAAINTEGVTQTEQFPLFHGVKLPIFIVFGRVGCRHRSQFPSLYKTSSHVLCVGINAEYMGEETIRMVLQYLGDAGYTVSMKTLADEHNLKTKHSMYAKRHMSQMRNALLEGEWGLVDKMLAKQTFKTQPLFQYAVLKQRYLELLDVGDNQKAFELISQRLKPLEAQQAFSTELKDLCYGLLSNPQKGLKDWDRARARHKLVDDFQTLLAEGGFAKEQSQLPANRLMHLLHQACAYQASLQRHSSHQRRSITSLLVDYEDDATPTSCQTVLQGHTTNVKCLAFVGADHSMLASGSSDNTVRVWDLTPHPHTQGAAHITLTGHTSRVWEVACGPNTKLASASGDGTVKVWDYRDSAAPLATYSGHQGDVYSVSYHPSSNKLGSGGYDATARLWDTQTGQEISKFTHTAPLTCIVFNQYGNSIITAAKDGNIRFCDLAFGVETMTLQSPAGAEISHIELDPSGLLLLASYRDSCNRLWDLRSTLCLSQRFKGHRNTTKHFMKSCFGPKGDVICSASEDGGVHMWGKAGNSLAVLQGHQGPCFAVKWSPQQKLLASCGQDQTVRLWQCERPFS